MRVNNIVVVILGIVFNTVADQTNSDSEASGLSLEIEEDKINREDKKVELKLIEAQKFIGEAKTIIDKANNVLVHNNNSRRNFSYTKLERFTDFIRHVIKILQKYDDKDLKLFFAIINGEVKKYHYRGCKFHELIDNDGLRMFMGKKLDTIKSMTVADIRKVLATIATKIEKEDFDKNEKEFVDFINSIYRKDAVEKFNKVLLNIDNYRLKSRRNIDLTGILRKGIESVIFDYYTNLTHNVRIAFKSKLEDFWNYIMSVSSSYVMQNYLGNKTISNAVKIFDAGSLSEESSVKTTKEEPMTLRQMYLEETIDLKCDPYAYHLTTNYRSVSKKAFSYKTEDPYSNIILASAKPTHDSPGLRQNYIENNNSKYSKNAKTHTIKEKRSGKSKSSDKHKHYTTTTDDLRTLRQMHVESMDPKYNSQVNNDSTKSKSKNDKTSRVHQLKSFDNYNYLGKLERLRKTSEEARTVRQMYLKHFDFKYYEPHVNTNSTDSKRKDNRPKHVRTPNKGKNKDKGRHTVKTTDDPTTPREMYVEIMNFKYEQPINKNSKEFINKSDVSLNKKKDKKKRKYILRERKTKDNIGDSKTYKQTNIYIDIDTKYITRDDKHKTTKDVRVRKQRYLEKKNNYLSTVMRAQYERQVLDRVTTKLIAQTTHPKKQVMMRKTIDDVREDKRHTTGKPTALEIIEEHNAIINVNAATTRKARRNSEDRNVKQNFKKVITPLLAKVVSNQLVTSATSKIKDTPLKKATSVTNRRIYYIPDNTPSEEGLSIEAFKKSDRRVDSYIHTDNISNDTNVITKIKQLENELKVFKTKLLNDTDIIENLNTKLCETRNKLKEFCNQEYKVLMKNKNASEEFDSKADVYENVKHEEDKSNEFYNNLHKRFKVKRNFPSQYNENKNKQALSTKLNKDGKLISNQSNQDIERNTLLERSKSDIKIKEDVVDKTREREYNIDAKKLSKDLDNISSVSKSSEDRIKNYNIKHVSTSNVNNNKYKEQEKGKNPDVGTQKFHAKIDENVDQKYQLQENEFKKYQKNHAGRKIKKYSSAAYNFKTYKQHRIDPEGREIMNNKNIDLDTNKENYVQVIDKNDYSDEIESNYNDIESEKTIDLRTLPTRVMSSLVTLKKINNINVNPNKIKLDVTQENTEIHNDGDVIKVSSEAHVHDTYTKPKRTQKNSILVDNFDKDGVVIDGEKYNQIEAGDAVQDKPTIEAAIIVKQ